MPGNNWDLLIKAIVVMSIMAIWAITSLFNRESRPVPPTRPGGPIPPPGPRPTDPTLRWSPTSSPATAGPRRVAIGDDDILIISSEGTRATRPGQGRPIAAVGGRRPAKARPAPKPAQLPEPPPTRARLAGVSQNVNQQLAKSSLGLSPLDAPMPTSAAPTSMGLSSAPSQPIHAPSVTISAVAAAIADPVRLREAFIINEILRPPLALRGGPSSVRR